MSASPNPFHRSSTPQNVPAQSSPRASSPAGSYSRAASIARLGSPVPSQFGTPPVRQIPTPSQFAAGGGGGGGQDTPGSAGGGQHVQPGTFDRTRTPSASVNRESALAAALRSSEAGQFRMGTPPRTDSPASAALAAGKGPASNYGSFDQRRHGSESLAREDLEVVRRHLAGPSAMSSSPGRRASDVPDSESALDQEGFSSLRMQGGDITRPIYRLVEQEQTRAESTRRRSMSLERPTPEEETLNIKAIKQPGGLRRDFIRRTHGGASPSLSAVDGGEAGSSSQVPRQQPQIFTTNFIEFLSLYGHFAGEDFEEEDESDEYFSSDTYGEILGGEGEEEAPGERQPLLRRRRTTTVVHGATPRGAALLLLKSFVGTGVLFLPKAFLNGGMLFSSLLLLFVAGLSYYCFLLLCWTRIQVPASFGGMGYRLYGKPLRNLINFSLVISQIGFSSAYIVFVSENLQAFVLAVSDCKTHIPIKFMILMQMIIFLPLSLYRNIQNIQKIAIVADIFILLGLVYLYYFDIFTLAINHGVADIELFNSRDWTLFIGTAIFTFEGIGLIIPIQESMAQPTKFPPVLGMVMIIITVVFSSMGALSYAAYGSHTKTVVLLNMPQDSKFVNGVQFIYSLAILLSTPLQFFPAIEITSKAIFKKTGKNNPVVKWKKNIFRFLMVVLCAMVAWVGADDLDKFVALVGSFACIPLVYIYPPMLHYRGVSRKTWQKVADGVLIVFGFLSMAYTTSLTLKSWASGEKTKSPGYCDGK